MKYVMTLKKLQLNPKAEKVIERALETLKRKLTNFVEDIPELSIFIKKHDKNHFFSGLITLTLPKKKLTAIIAGHTLHEVLHKGFEKINKEFEKYKGTHFKGSSKYPNHESLNTYNWEHREKR